MLLTVAADVGDADTTRTVWAIIALLVVMGLALVMLAFWVRRATRPDPEYLAPLELMDDRSWRRGDAVWQRRRLDEVRPDGAVPLARTAAPPTFDESFDDGPTGTGFEDLHEDLQVDLRAESVDDASESAETRATDVPDADADSEPDDDATVDGVADDDMADGGVAEPADVDDRGEDDRSATGRVTRNDARPDMAPTPTETERPPLDQLPDGEVDESALKRALDELDAELQRDAGDR